ncbi:uncharacterized membrane protein YcaP (DUF421 family) [Anaerobacterium chartisolvens]|uniref:Uncharacterized membrane protein YcaP (DUF421 family) n=1 Tax=Anaerobacterium chartisolvens TaxID=1297424 RepID=A0A369BHN1_9FIRM|nr:DUF421 domain-containing protein [Anaerobacterium chartisolvens]RCX21063.1 uncharacterized membrane protein YcaP (DUF421 family) [Anaerobacterium chartisolvens]
MQMWIQILLKTASLFFLTLVLVRLMGKRSMARITPFSFVSYIVIAAFAALMSVNIITNLAFGFISMGVWIFLVIALEYLSIKSKWIHDLVNGRETVLIKKGKIMEENLMQSRLTGEELLRELRSKNAFNLADVEFAVMEATGEVNVFLKADKKPVTPHDLGQKVAPAAEPQTVIIDGNVINEALASLSLNREWLELQLKNQGVSLDNVFLGQANSSGELYLDLFDDFIELPKPKVKEMLYANLEKAQAGLAMYSLETEDRNAKAMYSRNAKRLRELMKKLEPYLLR